mmetsp:Transcript_41581/g.134337  ORF Transcript_41581/g.134337 Transcript_41581/m.134337 type:complete len:220 (-) Transcript_41581:4703-5362(-)
MASSVSSASGGAGSKASSSRCGDKLHPYGAIASEAASRSGNARSCSLDGRSIACKCVDVFFAQSRRWPESHPVEESASASLQCEYPVVRVHRPVVAGVRSRAVHSERRVNARAAHMLRVRICGGGTVEYSQSACVRASASRAVRIRVPLLPSRSTGHESHSRASCSAARGSKACGLKRAGEKASESGISMEKTYRVGRSARDGQASEAESRKASSSAPG